MLWIANKASNTFVWTFAFTLLVCMLVPTFGVTLSVFKGSLEVDESEDLAVGRFSGTMFTLGLRQLFLFLFLKWLHICHPMLG